MSLKLTKIGKLILIMIFAWFLYIGFTFYIYRDSYLCTGCKTYVDISKEDYVYRNGEYYHKYCYKERDYHETH